MVTVVVDCYCYVGFCLRRHQRWQPRSCHQHSQPVKVEFVMSPPNAESPRPVSSASEGGKDSANGAPGWHAPALVLPSTKGGPGGGHIAPRRRSGFMPDCRLSGFVMCVFSLCCRLIVGEATLPRVRAVLPSASSYKAHQRPRTATRAHAHGSRERVRL